ncbi:MAG: hypothetical protein WC717_06470 [Candidatus Micrarchaeia archaeon]|jgi:hypothetical protein
MAYLQNGGTISVVLEKEKHQARQIAKPLVAWLRQQGLPAELCNARVGIAPSRKSQFAISIAFNTSESWYHQASIRYVDSQREAQALESAIRAICKANGEYVRLSTLYSLEPDIGILCGDISSMIEEAHLPKGIAQEISGHLMSAHAANNQPLSRAFREMLSTMGAEAFTRFIRLADLQRLEISISGRIEAFERNLLLFRKSSQQGREYSYAVRVEFGLMKDYKAVYQQALREWAAALFIQ